MNSSEQKDFEHITPTQDEINETIGLIRSKLNIESSASDARGGYELALQILEEKSLNYTDIPLKANSDTGKAIAVLAINYLKGESSQNVLMNFGAQ